MATVDLETRNSDGSWSALSTGTEKRTGLRLGSRFRRRAGRHASRGGSVGFAVLAPSGRIERIGRTGRVAKELPGVLAELDGDPWISIGVSVRSTTIAAITPAFAIVATAASADRHAVFEAAVKGDRLLVAGHEVSGLLGEHRPGRLAAVLELLQRN